MAVISNLVNPTLNSSGGTNPASNVPFIQPYSSSGQLSDSNIGGNSILGMNASTNTGDVAQLPQVNLQQQVVANQYNQAQQQQGESAIQTALSKGANSASNLATNNSNWFTNSVTTPINSFGNSALGFAAPGVGATSSVFGSSAATAAENTSLLASTSTGSAGELAKTIGAGTEWAGTSATAPIAPAWTSASLSGTLGAASLGYMGGGFLANALGENPQGGAIGGAIGAGAGFAIGAAYGSVGGPVGALAGGVIGAIGGGLFGNNKPSDQTQVGIVTPSSGQINPDGMNKASGTGSKFSQQNADLRNNAQMGASNLAQWLIANGATPNNSGQGNQVVIKVGSRDGYQVGTQDYKTGQLNYNTTLKSGTNPNQLYDSVSKTILSQYNLPPALQSQMQNINSSAFYDSKFNLQNAISNPGSLIANGQNGNTNNFATPTVATQNNNGRGILQVPANKPTGQ